MSQNNEAGVGPLERPVRALDPERAEFEAWCVRRWCGDRNALGRNDDEHPKNPGEYTMGNVEFAWQAWREACPKRAAVGRLINLAADCAQRKPLRGLEPLTEVTHIGHRQFGRAYEQVDEAVRQLACDLRGVADAL